MPALEPEPVSPSAPVAAAERFPSLRELRRLLVEQDEALTGEERAYAWTRQMRTEAFGEGDISDLGQASGLIMDLIGVSPVSGVPSSSLAGAFASHHLHWLRDVKGVSTELFIMLAQLLRYHYPHVAAAIEADAQSKAAPDLAKDLEDNCGGVQGLARMLLSPKEGGGGEVEFEALRLLCDLVVLEEREGLLLLVAVELIAQARRVLGVTAFQQLRGRGLAGRGFIGVRQCLEGARVLHEKTPLSLIFAMSSGGWATKRLARLLPVCSVAADELLHHVFERKGGCWRLLVVDVRGKRGEAKAVAEALPVCLRMDPSQDRQEVLRDMPVNDSIHLCLMGDGPPGLPGDQALELCRTLSSEGRLHVSVAEGGWSAIKGLAETLELELVSLEPSGPRRSSTGQKGVRGVLNGVLQNISRGRAARRAQQRRVG